MTDLPMQLHHQQAIRDGVKTTTLRGKVWPAGVYRMAGRGGVSLGSVDVHSMTGACCHAFNIYRGIMFEVDGSINWTHQTDEGKTWLAQHEGGYTVAEFEQFMRGWHIWGKPFGKRFINGERNLFLHSLVYIAENTTSEVK